MFNWIIGSLGFAYFGECRRLSGRLRVDGRRPRVGGDGERAVVGGDRGHHLARGQGSETHPS